MSPDTTFSNPDRALLTPEIQSSPLATAPLSEAQTRSRSIVFIDANVSDAETLIAGVQAGTEVYLLNPETAIAQITQTLLGRSGIESLQILSHGRAGAIQLGETWLDAESLDRYADHLRSWGSALTESADILLYGCNVAAGELGQTWIDRVSQLTGADIAASDDLTGKGGDWLLEVQSGEFETVSLAFKNYQYTLATLIDINPGNASSFPSNFTNINGTLFFAADDGITGMELWKSNGTAAGTVRVADINPGSVGSFPSNFTDINGTLFFAAFDDTTGMELWKSDGTATGTVQVADINPGTAYSNPSSFININGTLFFTADDGSTGIELWKSDGTAAGTALVADISPGSADSNPSNFININGTLFFAANDELWKSDGTAAGTVQVNPSGIEFNPNWLININNTLFFTATESAGWELWKSDGTAAGTVRVADINPGSADATPFWLTDVNGTLFFAANDGTTGNELWKSDGTAAGTVRVADINPGIAFSNPASLTNVNGTLFFTADSAVGNELWKSDGTAAGTVRVTDINPGGGNSFPSNLTNVNGTLFFVATDGSGYKLWQSDGTAAGTVLVNLGGSGAPSFPISLMNANGTLFISTDDGTAGRELWVYSATPTVTLTTTTPSVTEGNSGSITISRGSVTSGSLTVNLAIDTPNTTASSTDYTLSQGGTTLTGTTFSVTIPDGSSSITLTFAAIAEALGSAEAAEAFKLNLATGSGYTIGTDNTATLTIAQNDFVVINTNDSGEGSLRQAILNANAIAGNDTITFAGSTFTDATPDTITLTTGELLINSNITINGTGANLLTISGNNALRVLNITTGIVGINNLEIANGNSGSSNPGGGIYNTGSLTITNSIVRNNTGQWGGGIHVAGAGSLVINSSTLFGNSATFGGAILNIGNAFVTINSSTIRNNTATAGTGGGLYSDNGTVNIINSTINNNTSSANGGGIVNTGNGTMTITNSTISGNTGASGGGIRHSSSNSLTLLNVTIANNTATSAGGGISRAAGTVNLKNTLVAGNNNASNPDLSGDFVDQGNNLISRSDGSTGFTNGVNGNIVGTIAAPVNAFLAPLANNGGTTQTHSLLPGSPAINNGTSSGAPTQDQRGITRTGAFDIGALELQNVAPVITLPSGTVNYVENATPLILDSSATITDADNPPNFNTGVLTVSLSANGTADDRLAIRNQGTGAGQIGVSGSTITFGGTAIATFTGGIGTTNLAITFNTNATIAAVQALLQNLTFETVSETPSTLNRTVSFVMTDGAGGTSTIQTKTVSVTAIDDITVLSNVTATLNYLENGTLLVASGLTLSDLDGASETLDSAQVAITANYNSLHDRLGIQGQTGTSGTISGLNWLYDIVGGMLIITGTADLATYQSVLRQVVYTNLSDNPTIAPRNLQFNITPTKRYYEFIPTVLNPMQALTAASSRTFQGMRGYLATITSAAENTTIQNLMPSWARAWMSAGDVVTEGTWRWMTGPEVGRRFWVAGTGVVNGGYNNWAPFEPNNWGGNEDYAEIVGSGIWNDMPDWAGLFYVVEYGGGDVQQTGNVTINVIRVNDAPSFTAVNQRTRMGQQVIPLSLWTRDFSLGPEETDQAIESFIFTNSNPGMFTEFRFENDGTLVFTPSNALLTPTTATINVRVRDDAGTANGGINESTIQTFTITVVPPPRIVIENVSRAEGNTGTTLFNFNVGLTHIGLDPVTVSFGTEDMSARVADRDYASTFGTLTFAPGELRKTIAVRVLGDTRAEPIEQFLVRLSNPINGIIQAGVAIGTIFTDDSGSWFGTTTNFASPTSSIPTTTFIPRTTVTAMPTPVISIPPTVTAPTIITVTQPRPVVAIAPLVQPSVTRSVIPGIEDITSI